MMSKSAALEREVARLQDQLDAIHRALDEQDVPRRDPNVGLHLSAFGRVRLLLERTHHPVAS